MIRNKNSTKSTNPVSVSYSPDSNSSAIGRVLNDSQARETTVSSSVDRNVCTTSISSKSLSVQPTVPSIPSTARTVITSGSENLSGKAQNAGTLSHKTSTTVDKDSTNLRCTVIVPGPVASTNNNNNNTANNNNNNNNNNGGGTTSSSGSSSIASPSTVARRPTHRRGLSHGSFSLLNSAPNNNHSTLPVGPGSSVTKANTLTLGVPGLHQYSNSGNSNHPTVGHHYTHLQHYSSPTSSTMKANSSEYLSHADSSVDGTVASTSAAAHSLHPNQSGTSLVSQSSSTPPNDDIKRAIAHIEQKIRRTKDSIKEEQLRCDDNVNEYLKLSANAEPNQSSRLRTVFENNNKKSTQKISRLQKKLKGYDEKVREIKDTGVYARHTREKLKDGVNMITGISGGVIEGIKSGIHSAGETVITKPKEFFKRSTNDTSNAEQAVDTNGSTAFPVESTFPADVSSHGQPIERDTLSPQSIPGVMPVSGQNASSSAGPAIQAHHNHSANALNSANSHSTKCTSDDESSTSITSGSGQVASGGNHSFNNSAHLSSSPLKMKPLIRTGAGLKQPPDPGFEAIVNGEFEQLRRKLDERTEDCIRLFSDVNLLKGQYQNDVLLLNQALQDEKYRVDRLEEQLNDLTELHQREIENLRQTITDLEEKMLYQTEERHRDVHEMLESFQTRISRMEHQQHQHLQQLVNLDSLENSNARALVLKLINVLLTVLQVVLLLVATLANILSPFLHTRARIFTSVLVILFFSFVFQHWPELTIWTKQKIYETCLYVLSRLPFLSFDDPGSS